MNIVVIGASGMVGSRIVNEAIARGHTVTGVVRDASKVTERTGLTVVKGDVLDPKSIAQLIQGKDAVISAFAPSKENPDELSAAANSLLEACAKAGVKRLLVIGGAGGLEVAPGVQYADSPEFNAAWKPIADGHRRDLQIYRKNDTIDWTVIAPAALLQPGKRTGSYRTSKDKLIIDGAGNSHISAEDYAIAMLDELDHPKHIRERFAVGD